MYLSIILYFCYIALSVLKLFLIKVQSMKGKLKGLKAQVIPLPSVNAEITSCPLVYKSDYGYSFLMQNHF